jgi:hypothetical protein
MRLSQEYSNLKLTATVYYIVRSALGKRKKGKEEGREKGREGGRERKREREEGRKERMSMEKKYYKLHWQPN